MESKPKLLRITTVPISLYKLIKGQAKFMESHGFTVHLASADGKEVTDVITAEGVPHHVIPYTRKITPFQDLWTLWLTILLIRKLKPAIVHTHTPKAGLIGMLAAWLCRVPHRLHTVAGLPLLETEGVIRKLLNTMERLTSFCATEVLPNSFELKRIMIENSLASVQKLKVIANGSSNGIDTSYFLPNQNFNRSELRMKLGIDENDLVFVFVGRLVKDKGINELVEAFKTVLNKHPACKLLLVGDREDELDPLAAETIKAIKEIPQIISAGWQDDVRSYLAISDVFTFPSYREGFPNVVLQAGAMELPCIVSNINGCNEIIKEDFNGCIIPTKNAEALIYAMEKVADNESYREKLKSNARAHVVAHYEQQLVWEALLNEYNSLLKL